MDHRSPTDGFAPAGGLLEAVELAKAGAARMEADIVSLLRDLIAIPSLSGQEELLARRVERECQELGLEAHRDACGNAVATLGHGARCLVYDAHMDTVGAGDLAAWPHDPWRGRLADGIVFGRGASDNKGALAAMIAGLVIARDLGISDRSGYRLQLIGVVEEEVCEGWAIGEAISSGAIAPDYVVLGECTNLDLARGHRGRAEMALTVRGLACHGSSPWRGHNAIYDLAAWTISLAEGAARLPRDAFLGPASLAVTQIAASSGSPNVIPEIAAATVDRRTIPGETAASIERQLLAAAPAASRVAAELVHYAQPSYTGLAKRVPKDFPAWALPARHPLLTGAALAAAAVSGREPAIGRWEFSTDGVMTMGRLGIPTIGFGPAEEQFAHTVLDQVPVHQLVAAAAFYAVLPLFLPAAGR